MSIEKILAELISAVSDNTEMLRQLSTKRAALEVAAVSHKANEGADESGDGTQIVASRGRGRPRKDAESSVKIEGPTLNEFSEAAKSFMSSVEDDQDEYDARDEFLDFMMRHLGAEKPSDVHPSNRQIFMDHLNHFAEQVDFEIKDIPFPVPPAAVGKKSSRI